MSSPLILCLLVLLFGTCLASPIVKRDADADCDNSLGTDYYDPLLCPPTSSSSSTTEEPTTETTTAESGEEDVKMVRKREVEEEPEVSTDQSTSSTTESVEMRPSADKCIRATQDVSGCCTVFTDSEAQQQQCIRDHTGVENTSDSSSEEAEEEDSKVPSN